MFPTRVVSDGVANEFTMQILVIFYARQSNRYLQFAVSLFIYRRREYEEKKYRNEGFLAPPVRE
jgi:hypothetical protein